MTTFAVADVSHSVNRLRSITVDESIKIRLNRKFEASSSNVPSLVRSSVHGFVDAVHAAFDNHHPLILSPDDIWLCLIQGFAMHVNANAETLRSKFVQHEGKKELCVRRDDFVKGSDSNDWPGMFSMLADKIAEHTEKTRSLIVADFSTTGIVERAASEIVLFDSMRSFFNYRLMTACGIPEITLLGTLADWVLIRKKAEAFAEFGLDEWVQELLPILDQFVNAKQGKVDVPFWESFYKSRGGSGGPYANGWINVLFPYLKCGDRPVEYNGMVTGWKRQLRNDGVSMDRFPSGLSSVPFIWEYYTAMITMLFVAGFIGISQDTESGAVRPAIGWAICEE